MVLSQGLPVLSVPCIFPYISLEQMLKKAWELHERFSYSFLFLFHSRRKKDYLWLIPSLHLSFRIFFKKSLLRTLFQLGSKRGLLFAWSFGSFLQLLGFGRKALIDQHISSATFLAFCLPGYPFLFSFFFSFPFLFFFL